MLIYYNPKYDQLGILNSLGFIQISEFNINMALTDEWELVSYL